MRVTAILAQPERKRQDKSACYSGNAAAEQERGGFAAGSAQFRQPARPQTPLAAKNVCQAGRFRRTCRQTARHLGNVGQQHWEMKYGTAATNPIQVS